MKPEAFCPVHEYAAQECCACCVTRRKKLRRVDLDLRSYWRGAGLSFKVRGRSAGRLPCGVHGAIAVRGLEPQYAPAT